MGCEAPGAAIQLGSGFEQHILSRVRPAKASHSIRPASATQLRAELASGAIAPNKQILPYRAREVKSRNAHFAAETFLRVDNCQCSERQSR